MLPRSALSGYGGVQLESMVHGASGVGLVVLLYDTLTDELTQAQLLLANKKYQDCGRHCAKALTILAGLRETLDFERGEPVSSQLLAFYNAVTSKIMAAQVRRDPSGLAQAIELITSVRDAWRQLAANQGSPGLTKVTAIRRVDDLQSSAAAPSGAGVAAVC